MSVKSPPVSLQGVHYMQYNPNDVSVEELQYLTLSSDIVDLPILEESDPFFSESDVELFPIEETCPTKPSTSEFTFTKSSFEDSSLQKQHVQHQHLINNAHNAKLDGVLNQPMGNLLKTTQKRIQQKGRKLQHFEDELLSSSSSSQKESYTYTDEYSYNNNSSTANLKNSTIIKPRLKKSENSNKQEISSSFTDLDSESPARRKSKKIIDARKFMLTQADHSDDEVDEEEEIMNSSDRRFIASSASEVDIDGPTLYRIADMTQNASRRRYIIKPERKLMNEYSASESESEGHLSEKC